MPATLYDPNNVKVGEAYLFYAPWIAGQTPTAMPADSTPLFTPTSWNSPWASAGATDEGYKVTVDSSTTQITIEEQALPVDEQVESKTITVEASLAEDTMKTLQLFFAGASITTTNAGTTTPGTEKMVLSSGLKLLTIALEMANPLGLARRIYIPKVSAIGSGDVSFRRASAKHMYPLRFTSLCKPEEIQIVNITAAPTGP